MTLVLRIVNGPAGVAAETRRLDSGSLGIGRGPRSDWVLPDPDRLLSKRHCVVARAGDRWEVSDTSSNGTYLNGETQALGGAPRILRDGDRLLIGAYEISADIRPAPGTGAPEAGAPGIGSPGAGRDDGTAPPCFGAAGARLPEGPSERLPGDPFPSVENDPLGISLPPVRLPADFVTTRADHLQAIAAEFRPPRPSLELLPDDWDVETPAPPSAPLAATLPQTRQEPPLQARPEPPQPLLAPQPAPAAAATVTPDPIPRPVPGPTSRPVQEPVQEPAGSCAPGLAAFAAGAGLAGPLPADPDALLRGVGAAFRAVVAGLRQTMIARTAIKSGFRIDQTVMRAAGNNPLKFSADDDDALAGLLGIGRRTDMTAQAAIGEVVRDIGLHELATTSAMQRATRDLLASLAPGEAAARAGASLLDLLPGRRAARRWRAYEALHASVVRALSDDLDGVFGRSFMRAYEQATRDAEAQGPPAPPGRAISGATPHAALPAVPLAPPPAAAPAPAPATQPVPPLLEFLQ